jgi:alkanesulfonate monooxygenase SsuD/methylene tetrahydromethanopterin reductase-like flavin-dependent oxidoreductase (luciferase family)
MVGLEVNEPEDDARRARLVGSATAVSDKINAYREAGLDHLVCYFRHENETGLMAQLERFAAKVMPAINEQ